MSIDYKLLRRRIFHVVPRYEAAIKNMGVTASRELSDAIAAGVNQGRGLENLLEDPKVNSDSLLYVILLTGIQFIRQYRDSCQALPIKSRRKLLTKHKPRDKRGKTYLFRIQRVQKEDFCISESLEPFFQSWKQPTKFFNQFSRLQGISTVSQVYKELRHIDMRVDDPIRARIYAVALFDLRVLVDEKVSLRLRPEVKQKVVQIISESPAVNDSLEDVVKWTELYLKFGERMKEITSRNGGLGALILMPPSLLTMRQ